MTGRIMSDPIKFWSKHQENEYFPEISKTPEEGSVSKKLIKNLGLYIDQEQIMKCRGTTENDEFPYQAKELVSLSKLGYLTKLMINEAH